MNFTEARQEITEGSAHWLIRATYDRWIVGEKKLIAAVKKAGNLGSISFELPAARGEPKRLVKQIIYAKRVTSANINFEY